MMIVLTVASIFTAGTGILTAAGGGSREMQTVPDFTQGGQKDENHDWMLGPTGARGWVFGSKGNTNDARQILVTAVTKGSPADGILDTGDVILGVGAQRFSGDARVQFANAITKASQFLRWYVNKGAIPYGDHQPWPGHEDNGKCSNAAVLFDLLGDLEAAAFFAKMGTAGYAERERGHTGNFFNMLWALPGVSRCGPLATGTYAPVCVGDRAGALGRRASDPEMPGVSWSLWHSCQRVATPTPGDTPDTAQQVLRKE